MADIRSKPFYLDEEAAAWVEDALASMTDEEKIGQLFINLFFNLKPGSGYDIIKKYHIGGARYINASAEQVLEFTKSAQQASRIPLLIAANCETGGNGACKDGTYLATAAQVEATRSDEVAYNQGLVSGREAAAIGANWIFGPISDILVNWRNTVVNTRSYGADPDEVIRYSSAFIKGMRQSNIASCTKHFPGDGVEERDQHLVTAVNNLSSPKWHETFGKVYKSLIDQGLMSIMAGHIMLPNIQRELVPGIKDEKIMPATIAPELLNGLLRKQLGFNGVIVSDASHMVGLSAAMNRKDCLPRMVAAGCDMILFFNDPEEDFQFVMDGYRQGVITEVRLHDAVRRILGLKAALGLHKYKQEEQPAANIHDLSVVGCADHLKMADDAADLAITLVKDTHDLLPIRPETHKRIKLHYLFGEVGNLTGSNGNSLQIIIEELESAGFDVTLADTSKNRYKKGRIAEYSKQWDAAMVFADVSGYAMENNYRIRWNNGSPAETPWFVSELPTIFISLNYTTHLHDVPMMRTYINSYGNTRSIIRQTIQKIMGDSSFKGRYNDLVFCDKWDTHL